MKSIIFCATILAICIWILLANPPKGKACTTTFIMIDGKMRQCQQCGSGPVICM